MPKSMSVLERSEPEAGGRQARTCPPPLRLASAETAPGRDARPELRHAERAPGLSELGIEARHGAADRVGVAPAREFRLHLLGDDLAGLGERHAAALQFRC